MAPLIVEQADNDVVRVVVAVVGALVVAGAVWVSKSRRAELMVEPAPTVTTEERAKVEA
jgi:hypothetical protein